MENFTGGGYIHVDLKPTDYVKGVSSPLRGIGAQIDWRMYRPELYLQLKNGFDSYGCVSWSAVQDIETQLNYSYQNNQLSQPFRTFLETNGYIQNNKVVCSKMYIAVTSGTTQQGNNFSTVAEAIRTNGLIPDTMYPFEPATGAAWHDVYKWPDQAMFDMGHKFLSFLNIGYHYLTSVKVGDLRNDLLDGPVQIAIPVCPGYLTDTPVKSCGLNMSHAVMIEYVDPIGECEVLDHYSWYTRLLSSDYPIDAALQYVISEKPQSKMKLVNDQGTVFLVGTKGKIGIADQDSLALLSALEDVETGSTAGVPQTATLTKGFVIHPV